MIPKAIPAEIVVPQRPGDGAAAELKGDESAYTTILTGMRTDKNCVCIHRWCADAGRTIHNSSPVTAGAGKCSQRI